MDLPKLFLDVYLQGLTLNLCLQLMFVLHVQVPGEILSAKRYLALQYIKNRQDKEIQYLVRKSYKKFSRSARLRYVGKQYSIHMKTILREYIINNTNA